MRKYTIIILFIFVLVLTSCAGNSDSHATNKSKNNEFNANFFLNGTVNLVYNAKFQLDSTYEGKAEFQIINMGKYSDGNLYSIELTNLSVDLHKYDIQDRLNIGCFYVKENCIFKINPTIVNLDEIKNGNLPVDSVLVCNHDNIPDNLQPNEKGLHSYIKVNEHTCEYHTWNNQVETGYYETMTWEKNKGLIYYKSGYGAGRDEIEYVLDEGINQK